MIPDSVWKAAAWRYAGRFVALAMAVCLYGTILHARDLYVVPAHEADADITPDGTRAAPFRSLSRALRSPYAAKADRIILRAGFHGTIKVFRAHFAQPVRIVAETSGRVHADKIIINDASGLHFQGLSVWPRETGPRHGNLLTTFSNAEDIRFDRFDIRGRADALETYTSWSKGDWLALRANGARLEGPRNHLTRSMITGVLFGITTSGAGARVIGNRITGFGGDAMRGLGDGSVFADNQVRDCVKISKNHDDGFQSWATRPDALGRKVVRGITLERNVILEWTGAPDHPLRCTLQGIGLFDGAYEGFTIRNNLVVVTAWHGIALYGGDKSRIVNNTVIHPSGNPAELPWIMLGQRKNGPPKGKILVQGNVAMAYRGIANPTRMNVLARFPARIFENPGALDFRPSVGGPLIDAANKRTAPRDDLTGSLRDSRPDIGALERN